MIMTDCIYCEGPDPECRKCGGTGQIKLDHRGQTELLIDAITDIMDKVNDIKEKVDEIMDKLNET